MNPKLTILIPGVPTRFTMGSKLYIKLFNQAKVLERVKDVEIIWMIDNWQKSLGEKRNAMLKMASGDYVCFCDDDDNVSEDYLSRILDATNQKPDVITFLERSIWNGQEGLIEFSLKHGFEFMKVSTENTTKRKPWHICIWRRELIQDVEFPNVNWDEDGPWADEAESRAKTEVHIPHVLHYYEHKDESSEALLRFSGVR